MTIQITTDHVRIDVADGTTMDGHVVRPAAPGTFPGILLLQEVFGVNGHIRDVAARLAREGYVVLAPDLFHRTNPGWEGSYDDIPASIKVAQAYTAEQSEADLRAASAHLAKLDAVEADHLGALGFCMGGRLAFTANAVTQLRAAVSYYGGGISPDKLHLASQLHGPTLFFWAGQDPYIPADQHRAVKDAMHKAGKPFVSVEFSSVSHGFFCDERKDYDEDAAAQSWAMTKEFLRRHLDW